MPDEPQNIPTEDQMKAGVDVVEAGEQAAAAETDPSKRRAAAGRAIKREAKSKGWELTPEQAEMLAGMVVAKLGEQLAELPDTVADKIGERGGFDHLPEPLTHGPATGAGTVPAEPPTPGTGEGADVAPGADRSSGAAAFARWFRGNR